MERKGELLYQRFLNTAQETVRLTAALEGFFLEADIEESQRDAYAAYLKRRIRPAMERLIRENALEKMDVLEQRGWVGAQEMDAFIRQAQSLGQEAAMLWLMRRKGERYGYHAWRLWHCGFLAAVAVWFTGNTRIWMPRLPDLFRNALRRLR